MFVRRYTMDAKLLVLILFSRIHTAFLLLENMKTAVACEGNKLDIKCTVGYKIVLHSATYGYSPDNVCDISHPSQDNGCTNDVISILDGVCTGNTNCSYPTDTNSTIPTSSLRERNINCKGISHLYIYVQYTCNIVAFISDSCEVGGTSEGIISPNASSHCRNQPIYITAPRLKYVILQIIDLNDDKNDISKENCVLYMTITEKNNITHVCATSSRTQLFTLTTNNTRVSLIEGRPFIVQFWFMPKCSKYEPLTNTTVEIFQNLSIVVLACRNHNNSKWTLMCHDNEWQGARPNCDTAQVSLVLVIGVGLPLLVLTIFAIAGIIIICARNCKRKQLSVTRQSGLEEEVGGDFSDQSSEVHSTSFHSDGSDDEEFVGDIDLSSLPPPRQSMLVGLRHL